MSTIPEKNYEELGTAFEQTIYALAKAYSDLGIYTLSQRQIEGIANALYLSDEQLAKALVRMDKPFSEERSKQSQLFGMLVRCYFILSDYECLNTDESQQALRKNIEIYEDLCVHFELLNAESATYERMYGQSNEPTEAVFGKLDFHINDFMPILKDLAWCEHYWLKNSHLLPVIYTILNYAFISHAKTLFLVVAIQIIKYSSLFTPAMRKIAEAFYNEIHLSDILMPCKSHMIDAAVLFGLDMNIASQTLEKAYKSRKYELCLHGIYSHIHFIPFDEFGIRLLRIITLRDWKNQLLDMLFHPSTRIREIDYGIEMDAYDGKKWWYSHLDGDIGRLIRLKEKLQNATSMIVDMVCYPYQKDMLTKFLGDRIRVHLVKMEDVERYLGLIEDEEEDDD